jgi:hypothetical protein
MPRQCRPLNNAGLTSEVLVSAHAAKVGAVSNRLAAIRRTRRGPFFVITVGLPMAGANWAEQEK